jgi:hypothetical protein
MNGAKLTLFLAVNISAQNTTTCAESANKIPGFNFQGAYTALSYPRFKIGAAREWTCKKGKQNVGRET